MDKKERHREKIIDFVNKATQVYEETNDVERFREMLAARYGIVIKDEEVEE